MQNEREREKHTKRTLPIWMDTLLALVCPAMRSSPPISTVFMTPVELFSGKREGGGKEVFRVLPFRNNQS